MSKLIRISDSAALSLDSLTKLTGESRQKLLDAAIKMYAYERPLQKANEQYAVLKSDPIAWKEMQKERKAWDLMLSDGLPDDQS